MLKQGLNQKLMQKLSPQQIQFIQLLQLTTAELEKRVDEELTQNPALEMEKEGKDDSGDNDGEPRDESAEREERAEKSDQEDEYEVTQEEFETMDDSAEIDISDYVSDDDDYSYNYTPRDPNEEDREIPVANYRTIYDNLYEQLGSLNLEDRKRELAMHLVGMLDEDGYLRRPLRNIVYDLAFMSDLQTNEEELEEILKRLQNFEPYGMGARSLQECLLIQLRHKDQSNENVHLAIRVIEDHMDALAKKHYQKLMKSLKIDRDKLREVVDIITHLNPKPGEGQINIKGQYNNPDFMVTEVDDELRVTLNSKNAPEMRVNRQYQETLLGYQKSNKEEKEKNVKLKKQVQFIKQRLDNAKWFIEAIKQRQNTLLMTMRTIVALQRDFFLSGDIMKLNPMILKDVADRIDMDISTVSRVVNSKYVQTDFGLYSLKEFFSEGIQTDEGIEVSNKEVKEVLQRFIEAEDKNRPLTDEKLTNMLNDKGYNIARRTVAKYREQLNIPVARLRKEL
ncbi:MAG: RNA polymerase factor sigma-54 [Bacteroidia bacterium]